MLCEPSRLAATPDGGCDRTPVWLGGVKRAPLVDGSCVGAALLSWPNWGGSMYGALAITPPPTNGTGRGCNGMCDCVANVAGRGIGSGLGTPP